MQTLRIIYASTSGHTEYVMSCVAEKLQSGLSGWTIEIVRVEKATPEDLTSCDLLLLASGTWNTGSVEGQLNPYMHMFLLEKAKAVDMKGKKTLVIGLGDERYRYTCRAADLLEKFVTDHAGALLAPTLRIINEPYGQEEKIDQWVSAITPHFA